MECYKIIHDEEKLLEFIDWLPDLGENEVFYVSLFARKKYCPELIKSNDKSQLKRFTSTKERLVDKIRQLEIPLGRYKIGDMYAPQKSLVLYINPNPRCMKKATKLMGKRCWELNDSNGYNLHQEAMSCIQQSKSYSYVVDFDIDTKEIDLNKLTTIFPLFSSNHRIVETRGGYHILINSFRADEKQKQFPKYPKNWFKAIEDTFPLDKDNKGDQLLPVPGCIQGGFIPKFI